VQARPDPLAQLERLGGERPALVLVPSPSEQPHQAGEPEGEDRALVALPGEADRLAIGDLGEIPAVGGGVVERDQVEHERERPDRRPRAGALQRVGEQPPTRHRVAQDDRRDGEPGQQVDVVAELPRLLGERDRLLDRPLSRRRVAADHPGQTHRRGGEEAGPPGGPLGQLVPGTLCDLKHRRRLAGVEARRGGLGPERHRTLGIGTLRDGGEDRVALHHRSAPDGDASRKLVEIEPRVLVLGRCPGLLEQRKRAVAKSRVPARLRGQAQQTPAVRRARHEPCRSLERDGRGGVGATAMGPLARLLERRRSAVVEAGGGIGKMPGAAVDVAVGGAPASAR
jgi:hypothetical protein